MCGDNVVFGLPLATDCEACGLAKLGQHAELLQDSFLKDIQFKSNILPTSASNSPLESFHTHSRTMVISLYKGFYQSKISKVRTFYFIKAEPHSQSQN